MVSESDPALTRYISAALAYPVLSREKELELVARWLEHHDDAAREELVRAHLRHVVAMALKYRRYGLPLGELIAEGNFAVAHRASGNSTPRVAFVSRPTPRIGFRAYVLDYVIRSWSMVGGGSGALRTKTFFRLRRERVRITNLVGRASTPTSCSPNRSTFRKASVASMLQSLDARDVSLDAKAFSDSPTTARRHPSRYGSEPRGNPRRLGSQRLRPRRGPTRRSAISTPASVTSSRAGCLADNEDELTLCRHRSPARHLPRTRAPTRGARKKKLKSRITELSRGEGWLDAHSAA